MMITKAGKVIVTEGGVEVNGFHFDGTTFQDAGRDALVWAATRIAEELAKPPAPQFPVNTMFEMRA